MHSAHRQLAFASTVELSAGKTLVLLATGAWSGPGIIFEMTSGASVDTLMSPQIPATLQVGWTVGYREWVRVGTFMTYEHKIIVTVTAKKAHFTIHPEGSSSGRGLG